MAATSRPRRSRPGSIAPTCTAWSASMGSRGIAHMDSHDLIGQAVGNYEVKALLGEGGMGTVYLAEHAFMGWRAAIKVLRRSLADDQVLVKRFINEARAVKAVRH